MGVQQLMLYLIFNISKHYILQSSKIGYAYVTRYITTASATPPATVCPSCVRYSAMDSTNQLMALQLNNFACICHCLPYCNLSLPNGTHPVFFRFCDSKKCQDFTEKGGVKDWRFVQVLKRSTLCLKGVIFSLQFQPSVCAQFVWERCHNWNPESVNKRQKKWETSLKRPEDYEIPWDTNSEIINNRLETGATQMLTLCIS